MTKKPDWMQTEPLDKLYDIVDILKEVEAKLHELFEHEMKYKGVVQVFPNSIYFPNGLSGKKVAEFFTWFNKKKKEFE